MRPEENPLDFPLSLGALGELGVYLAPDDHGEPRPIILDSPRRAFLESLVPLAEAAIRADLRRLTQQAEAELEAAEQASSPGGNDDAI
jgi:hypothetical protein